ncbi:MAG: TolC family protein [Thermaerobacterales bacterium]
MRFRSSRHLFVLLCWLIIGGVTAVAGGTAFSDAGAAGAQPPDVMHLARAVHLALTHGVDAGRARLDLEGQFLEAENLWRQHQAGPPSPQQVCVPGAGCFSVGGPSDLEKSQIERLLPLQVEVLRNGAAAGYVQRQAAARADTIEGYFNLMMAGEARAVHEASLHRIEAQLRQVEALLAGGVVPEIDRLRVRAGMAEAQAEAFAANQRLALAVLEFNRLLGRGLSDAPPVLPAPAFETAEARDLASDLTAALAVDAEVLSAAGRLIVAEKELTLYKEHHGTFPDRRPFRERELAIEEAELDLRAAREATEIRLRGAHSRLVETARRVEAFEQQTEMARRAHHITVLRYEAGIGTVVDVMAAEGDLRRAELAALSAGIDHQTARSRLDILLGAGVPEARDEAQEILEAIDHLF